MIPLWDENSQSLPCKSSGALEEGNQSPGGQKQYCQAGGIA